MQLLVAVGTKFSSSKFPSIALLRYEYTFAQHRWLLWLKSSMYLTELAERQPLQSWAVAHGEFLAGALVQLQSSSLLSFDLKSVVEFFKCQSACRVILGDTAFKQISNLHYIVLFLL